MKKLLLATALAAAYAGTATAETSVTLYGIVDAGIGYTQVRGGDGKRYKGGLINGVQSGSRWGLKGTEDLSDGLQAVFQLESGFDVGTGYRTYDDRLFGRQATVGLRSDAWGSLDLGRQTNIATRYFADIASPFGDDFDQASVGTAFSSAGDLRYDNMVMYQTPNIAGFQFGVGYSFNTSGPQLYKIDDEPNTRAITTGLRYDNGPLAAALTYDQFKTSDVFGPADQRGVTVKSYNLAGSYDFDIVKVHAGIGQTRDGWFMGPVVADSDSRAMWADDGLKVNSYTLGLSAPVLSGRVMASWSMADANIDSEYDKQHVYSLGYTYDLSKRTNVYAVGSYARHVLFQNEGSMKAAMAGVGIRHQF